LYYKVYFVATVRYVGRNWLGYFITNQTYTKFKGSTTYA
jgi:hypothetical protein